MADCAEELARLRRVHRDLMVLSMSGHARNVTGPHGVLDRGPHFLQKPFTGRALVAGIQDALASTPPTGARPSWSCRARR